VTTGFTAPKLPLVSIVITAHNYGRYLGAAIASVRAQSYREIECVVVDDGSTDNTAALLNEMQASDPDLRVLTLPENRGQGAASRIGFKASGGQYIVFMDADDMLAPDFVLTHVYVHLSSRIRPGLTSSDIWQTVDDRVVVSTGEALNSFIRSNPPVGAGAFRAIERGPNRPWSYAEPDPTVLDSVWSVPPGRTDWCWAPMTANMFRRDALTLVIDCDAFERLKIGTDVYLCTGVSILSGSLLIDRAMSIYRIHGGNAGTFQAQLQNLRTVWPASELSQKAKRLLLEHFSRDMEPLSERFWNSGPLRAAIEKLRAELPDKPPAPPALAIAQAAPS